MGVGLRERYQGTEGNSTKSQSDVQQGERVTGKGRITSSVESSSIARHTDLRKWILTVLARRPRQRW